MSKMNIKFTLECPTLEMFELAWDTERHWGGGELSKVLVETHLKEATNYCSCRELAKEYQEVKDNPWHKTIELEECLEKKFSIAESLRKVIKRHLLSFQVTSLMPSIPYGNIKVKNKPKLTVPQLAVIILDPETVINWFIKGKDDYHKEFYAEEIKFIKTLKGKPHTALGFAEFVLRTACMFKYWDEFIKKGKLNKNTQAKSSSIIDKRLIKVINKFKKNPASIIAEAQEKFVTM